MSKRYIMTFETAAIAVAAVAANPEAYAPGTLIWAETDATLHVVTAAGTLGTVTVV